MKYTKRVASICLFVFIGILDLFAVDVLDQIRLGGAHSKTPLVVNNGAITVTTKEKSSLVFETKEDLPPKGSVVTFRFSLKAEPSARVTYKYACKMKEGSSSFPNVKSNLKQKKQEFVYSALWNISADEFSGSPRFVIMLWSPGTYTLSSMDYSYSKASEVGETTLPALEGSIPLDSPEIAFEGTRYVRKYADHIEVDRFRSEYYKMEGSQLGFSVDNARGTSGIVLKLNTDSPTVTLSWGVEPQFQGGALDFALLLDGELQEKNYATRMKPYSEPFIFTFETGAQKGKPVLCEVTYPSYSNPYLLGIKLDDESKLYPAPEHPKQVYVAFGDSITQGTGQKGATHRTYAWILAHQNNLELFNLAVGGGKISVKAGEMLADWPHIDLISILIGFNDCMGGGRSVEEYSSTYNLLLDAIRKNHPKSKIVCITPTYPIDVKSKKTGIYLDEFRKAVVKMVKKRKVSGDHELYLIRGETLTSSNEGVHFTSEEASDFAEKLSLEMHHSKILNEIL